MNNNVGCPQMCHVEPVCLEGIGSSVPPESLLGRCCPDMHGDPNKTMQGSKPNPHHRHPWFSLDVVLLGVLEQLRRACHGAVGLAHNLAQNSSGVAARHASQIH